jgi:hypothetical protein
MSDASEIYFNYPYWWVSFKGGAAVFINAKGWNAAWEEGQLLGDVEDVRTLPQPTGDWSSDGRPGYCYQPERCAGRTTCPRADSCSGID